MHKHQSQNNGIRACVELTRARLNVPVSQLCRNRRVRWRPDEDPHPIHVEYALKPMVCVA